MPVVSTTLFESVEVDISNNKQLFIHPIHRVVAETFPVNLDLVVLSSLYDLKPGKYSCKHAVLSPSKKERLAEFEHAAVAIDSEGGGVGFRTGFEDLYIEGPGRYWVRAEISGGIKAEDILIRIEARKGAGRLNMKG
ncbi:MAG: hypothetical protein VKO64_08420 [Candidatus Sericytochromatia bacterium]|nr:hypothetical protein [Candidatus Sericytochromatia bacterium]